MIEREIAERNKILEIVAGSYLYGTNSDTSDRDYVGIFLPSEEYILGFKKVEEVDFSVKDKNENGKNTKHALDRKLYEFRKFITLAMSMNPNIVEILFVNNENIVSINEIGEELLSLRQCFVHKGLKQRFLGYAFSQKHKIVIKKDNYFDLIEAFEYLKKYDIGKTILEIALETNCPYFIKKRYDQATNINFIEIGDLNFNPATSVKRANAILQERLDKVGNRGELLTKHGFDVKYGMHLVRLMLEGVELLKTGELKFPLKEAEMLKDIRNGKWKIENILNYSYELEKEIEDLEKYSKLPDKPNVKFLEEFTIKILRNKLIGAI
jgi:predicted nucleotidyltransferase